MIGLNISAAIFCLGVMILNSFAFCDSVKRGEPSMLSLVFAILNGGCVIANLIRAIDGY